MLLLQLTGLSGAGKSTIAYLTAEALQKQGYQVEVIDGDVYRKALCKDLGFSKQDRLENISRLFFVGQTLVRFGVIVLLAAINPYEELRQKNRRNPYVRTVYLQCPIEELIRRDPKGLYQRALLEDGNPEKILNFTGISDAYEVPESADLILHTCSETVEESKNKLLAFIKDNLSLNKR